MDLYSKDAMKEVVLKNFQDNNSLIKKVGEEFSDKIIETSQVLINSLKDNHKLLIAGNGGSAADAQHISGELVNKFYHDRKALSAIALSTDTSVLTSWANDIGYDFVFERQIEAHGNPGDVFMAITTSGNSSNLIYAVNKSKERGLVTIALSGKDGGKMKGLCDYEFIVPSKDTARIQEAHKVIYHTICQLVEQAFIK